ncbi:succinate--CoA ligase [GDP-forming] subunit beta, mitochondrial [Planococcus citri]|uniref:succinate--CoA ligase [GDP-forming] subunit beta, mitochondrial n=1 Tax=Planococcus citri TaxID=170843 RepID=UPI0031F9DBA7
MILTSRKISNKLHFNSLCKNISLRHLSLLECRSKEILQKFDVNIQKFRVVNNAADAAQVPEILKAKEYVIKAQVHAGGRGLGHFNNGFKSGVHITKDPKEIPPILNNMIGYNLITKQTPKDGVPVKEVMVAESVDIKKETYFCILMDRAHNGPVVIASPSGGTDIENVAEKTPHLIKTIPISIFEGITDNTANEIASFLEFSDDLKPVVATQVKRLWDVFLSIDAVQVEINPLVQTGDDKIIALDAKVQCDDNAAFRQKEIFSKHDHAESDPKEVEAAAHNLNYIAMDGNIGCLVNGAGLAMATMDIIKLHGGEPANFLDVGGNVNEDQVLNAFQILLTDPKVKSLLVNVFGGIVNCETIAKGIVNATKKLQLTIPLTVRLAGTNVKAGLKLLEDSKLPIQFAENLDEAARKATSF